MDRHTGGKTSGATGKQTNIWKNSWTDRWADRWAKKKDRQMDKQTGGPTDGKIGGHTHNGSSQLGHISIRMCASGSIMHTMTAFKGTKAQWHTIIPLSMFAALTANIRGPRFNRGLRQFFLQFSSFLAYHYDVTEFANITKNTWQCLSLPHSYIIFQRYIYFQAKLPIPGSYVPSG